MELRFACVSQERDYIAIEREEEYYEIAKARLENVEQPLKCGKSSVGRKNENIILKKKDEKLKESGKWNTIKETKKK